MVVDDDDDLPFLERQLGTHVELVVRVLQVNEVDTFRARPEELQNEIDRRRGSLSARQFFEIEGGPDGNVRIAGGPDEILRSARAHCTAIYDLSERLLGQSVAITTTAHQDAARVVADAHAKAAAIIAEAADQAAVGRRRLLAFGEQVMESLRAMQEATWRASSPPPNPPSGGPGEGASPRSRLEELFTEFQGFLDQVKGTFEQAKSTGKGTAPGH